MGDLLARGLESLGRVLDGSKKPGTLKLPVLSHITDNFSDNRKIGEGGCSHVYKGILPSGKMVAVKKLSENQTIDERMFQQEVQTMMNVKHQNIVGFIGYCSHTEQEAVKMTRKHVFADDRERLLCFEYISKGSLEDHVTDELKGLEWHIRFQIIKGICQGLHHLHKEKSIIHMDLKPANILLNDDLVPKITDFGISRSGETSETMSEVRMYSPQYCALEYKLNGRMSFMSDIYSLGVIIKQMVTGSREEPNVDRGTSPKQHSRLFPFKPSRC
nr:probable serine/threonine-protein kinase PBL23 [Setaria viridis]XP_034582983.1 probable serine/threonine-protein kinase PBL23 [Setaria viridis]